MRLKPGVSLLGLRPETVVAMMAAQQVCRALGVDLVLTSVTDVILEPTHIHIEYDPGPAG